MKGMGTLPKTGGHGIPNRKSEIEAALDGWFQCLVCLRVMKRETRCRCSRDDRQLELTLQTATTYAWSYLPDEIRSLIYQLHLPKPVPPPEETPPPPSSPPLPPEPSALPLKETENLAQSNYTSPGGRKSSCSTNEDFPHAPPFPGASTGKSSTFSSTAHEVTQRRTFDGSTKSIQFVTVVVPLTRVPECILKRANPHITLPLSLPQLHSRDLLESASEPVNFEEVSPLAKPVEPGILQNVNEVSTSLVNNLSEIEAQTNVVSIPTGTVRSELESPSAVPQRQLKNSSNSAINSMNKDIKQGLSKKISAGQPIRNGEMQDKRPLCVFCGRFFRKLSTHFYDHLRSHIKEAWFECPHCGKGFRAQRSYNGHIQQYCREKNAEGRHSCPICQKSFRLKVYMQKHLQVHSRHRPIFRCSLCPTTFTNQSSLREHQQVQHEKVRHKCKECGALLTRAHILREHMKRHRNIKAHSCVFCDKVFVNKHELFRHIRRHTREFVSE